MPSMEERMSAVERALRLQDRERAVQRQLFTTALPDIHVRMDEHVTHADIAVLRDEMNQRMDAIQSDVSAILELLNRKFPPG